MRTRQIPGDPCWEGPGSPHPLLLSLSLSFSQSPNELESDLSEFIRGAK